ncbi:iron-sulfur cluster co-chaperone protein HscB [Culicoides brevitarsis]|uniref:iron-sulfur cluster co-chaperone protein HscB n=1 Tax=Culicoides brevitarsis TaxID=469753 RepID=UPI00307C38D1
MNLSRFLSLTSANCRQITSSSYQLSQNSSLNRRLSTNLNVVRRFTEKVARNCWKCEATGVENSVMCGKCGALTSPDTSRSYFSLLNVSESFDVNSSKLTENFRQLQSVVHPDKFSNKSEMEQKHAMDWSSLLNKAYSTLSTPFKRAEYMLSIKNVTIPERNETLDPEFLMEMMERNEEIAEFETRKEFDEYLEKLKTELDDLYKGFAKLLEQNETENALKALIRIRYVNNLEKKIKEKLYELKD